MLGYRCDTAVDAFKVECSCLTSVLSLLSQMSLSHVSTWWQNPKSVTSRKRSTLLWRHLLQCHTCILTSFSTLSQLSNICTVSPFSNFTVSCVYMMAEAKKCLEPQRYYSTLKASTAVSHLSRNIFLNTFSTISHLYCLSFIKFHCLMSLHDGRTQKVSWAAKVLLYSVSWAANALLW